MLGIGIDHRERDGPQDELHRIEGQDRAPLRKAHQVDAVMGMVLARLAELDMVQVAVGKDKIGIKNGDTNDYQRNKDGNKLDARDMQ